MRLRVERQIVEPMQYYRLLLLRAGGAPILLLLRRRPLLRGRRDSLGDECHRERPAQGDDIPSPIMIRPMRIRALEQRSAHPRPFLRVLDVNLRGHHTRVACDEEEAR